MPQDHPTLGRWRITSMDRWDQAFVDAEVEGYFRFDRGEGGEFQFGYVRGGLTCEATERDGRPAVEWSWEGSDEMDPASGRGWARVDPDDTLQGVIHFHRGDRSGFTAERAGPPREARPMLRLGSAPSGSPAGDAPPPPAPEVDLDRHRRLRAVLQKHQNAAVKSLSKAAMQRAGEALGIMEGSQLYLETDAELTIFFDHALYDRTTRGKTPIQRYLAKLPTTDDPDEQLVRAAMADARVSLYLIEQLDGHHGVSFRDLTTGETRFAVDESLARTGTVGTVMVYRLLPLPTYDLPNGAGFPVSPEAALALTEAWQDFGQGKNPTDLSDPAAREAWAAILYTLGFAEGGTGMIGFR